MRGALRDTGRDYRLIVHKSNKYIYAQILKLSTGETLFGAGSKSPVEVGKLVAQKAKTAKVSEVVFDRGRKRYHGSIKLLADAAREGGLKF